MKKYLFFLISFVVILSFAACDTQQQFSNSDPQTPIDDLDTSVEYTELTSSPKYPTEWFVAGMFEKDANICSIHFSGTDTDPRAHDISFGIILERTELLDVMLPSGKYSTETEDKLYKILKTSYCQKHDYSRVYVKKCQMYVTRTDFLYQRYLIDLYVQLKTGENYHLQHNGAVMGY